MSKPLGYRDKAVKFILNSTFLKMKNLSKNGRFLYSMLLANRKYTIA